jgi:hypothetical protein
MSAEAIARLREAVSRYHSDEQFHPEFQEVEHDLRVLLAAYDEAAGLLARLVGPHPGGMGFGAEDRLAARDDARAFLAKAGGK